MKTQKGDASEKGRAHIQLSKAAAKRAHSGRRKRLSQTKNDKEYDLRTDTFTSDVLLLRWDAECDAECDPDDGVGTVSI